MPSGNLFIYSRDGATPDAAYPGAIAITRGASNTAQYLVLVRSGTTTWAMGMLPNSNVLAIGNATALDIDFAGMFNLDHSGRLLLGRSGAPLAGLILDLYSDPAAPKALGLPVWNNATEQGSVTLQPGAFGFLSTDASLQYFNGTGWRGVGNADQIRTNHSSLDGLGNDDHPNLLWMNGRQFAQLVTGGTQAFADLILRSTSHNSRGLIIMGSSAYNEATQSFGIRTTNPQYALDVNGDTRFSISLNGIPRLSSGVLATVTGFDVGANGSIGINQTPDNSAVNIGITNIVTKYSSFGTNPIFDLPNVTNPGTLNGTPAAYARVNIQGVGIGYMPIYTVASGSAPTAPSGLTATAVSSTQINLVWTDNSNNEDTFRIERSSPTAASFAEINNVGPGVVNFSDTGLSASTAYFYRVRARNTFGDSAYTANANATTQAAGSSAIMDDFNRGNGTPLSTPTGGASGLGWSYAGNGTNLADLWSIVNNTQAAQLTGNGHEYLVAYMSGQSATGTVKGTMAALGGSTGGWLFRYDASSKIGYVVTNINAAQWRVYQINLTLAGSAVYADFRGGFGAAAPAATDVVEIIMTSGSSTVGFKLNGGTTQNLTCALNTTSANHGMFSDRISTSPNNTRWNQYEFL